jgi:hypothetical protein
MDEQRARKLAENEALAREVNERVGEVAAGWHTDDEPLEFICECSLAECTERIHLRLAEYLDVRSSTVRFALVGAHVNPEIEVAVDEAGDAIVVEKIGAGREVADETA